MPHSMTFVAAFDNEMADGGLFAQLLNRLPLSILKNKFFLSASLINFLRILLVRPILCQIAITDGGGLSEAYD